MVGSTCITNASRGVIPLKRMIILEIIRSREFKASRAWGAKDIANMNGITTRLHWTDQPYKWHINDGEEVFVVLDGVVEMLYHIDGQEKTTTLQAGDTFYASMGTEHVAHPQGVVVN